MQTLHDLSQKYEIYATFENNQWHLDKLSSICIDKSIYKSWILGKNQPIPTPNPRPTPLQPPLPIGCSEIANS